LTVTATVAEWLSLPAVPDDVPVIVTFPEIGAGDEEQPAMARRMTIAVAKPSRARSPLDFGSRKSSTSARISGTICHIEFGGVRAGGSGISWPLPVRDTVTATDWAVIPSAAIIGVATVQAVPAGDVQVNATL
jgi:hypothetical protein